VTYEYNKPRRLNLVSAFLLLVAIAAGYAGVKFIPVYWQARKVDEALDEVKLQASTFHRMNPELLQAEADKIILKAIARINDLGIRDEPDQPIQVWFSPDWRYLEAKYKVVVKHPVGNPTVMVMERKREVPGP
jgi:hypothetical protein